MKDSVRIIYNYDESEDDKLVILHLTKLLASDHAEFVRRNHPQVMRDANIGCCCPQVIGKLSDALQKIIFTTHGGETKRYLALLLLTDMAIIVNKEKNGLECRNMIKSINKERLQIMTRELLHLVSHYSIQLERFFSSVEYLIRETQLGDLFKESDAWVRILEHGLELNNPRVIHSVLEIIEINGSLQPQHWFKLGLVLQRIVDKGLVSSEHFDYDTTLAAFFPVSSMGEENEIAIQQTTTLGHDLWLECGQIAGSLLQSINSDSLDTAN